MKKLDWLFFVAGYCAVIALLVASILATPKHGVRRIDCTWAEISPDFTTKMREQCRALIRGPRGQVL